MSTQSRGAQPHISAFVSWAHLHDSEEPDAVEEWRTNVFKFAYQLGRLGVDVDLDLFHMHDDDIDWSTYGSQQISGADYILIVASAAYKARWEGTANPSQGAGAAREANVLKAEFDRDRRSFHKRVKLILLPGVDIADAPTELQSSLQRFPIVNFEVDGLADLLRTLTGHPEWPRPNIGELPPLPPRSIDSPASDSLRSSIDESGSLPATPATADPGRDDLLPQSERRRPPKAPKRVSDLGSELDSVRRALDASPLSRGIHYTGARLINPVERDHVLGLDCSPWPRPDVCPDGWRGSGGLLQRTISGDPLPVALREFVLRFPSAPYAGSLRGFTSLAQAAETASFHSYRVIRGDKSTGEPLKRIFLLHPGLNELQGMGLYYQLASLLIAEDDRTACVVRPFPGHLTRYPFEGFAETPLDRYLQDSSHLFHQFLRYMIESQWFLSTLARQSSYRDSPGVALLAESDAPSQSHLDTAVLADAIADTWGRLHDSSASVRAMRAGSEPDRSASIPTVADLHACISSLRGLLDLDLDRQATVPEENDDQVESPSIHVVGHGFGGFAAHALFMAWPFLIASCSVMSARSPFGTFADPEEWRSVLQALTYDLDNRIDGLDRRFFVSFNRLFHEVLKPTSEEALTSRLGAFGSRLLFVLPPGSGPIFKPRIVPEPEPTPGAQVLEIGDYQDLTNDRSESQSGSKLLTAWVPEMSQLVSRFADQVAHAVAAQPAIERDTLIRRLTPSELLSIGTPGALPPKLFERCMDDLVAREDGVLFVLANEIPDVLQDPATLGQRGAALYHREADIDAYCDGVRARARLVEENLSRMCFVLPANLRSRMLELYAELDLPSQSETIGRQILNLDPEERWKIQLATLRHLADRAGPDSMRVFDSAGPLSDIPDTPAVQRLLAHASQFVRRAHLTQIPSLPDCWLWVSSEALSLSPRTELSLPTAIPALATAVVDRGASYDEWFQDMSTEKIKLIRVSGARYNPRYRGRLILDPRYARRILVHAALGVALSGPITDSAQLSR